jgi:hypothetical protein
VSNREPVALLQEPRGIARLTFGSSRILTLVIFVGPQLLGFGLLDVEPGVVAGKFGERLAGGDVDVVLGDVVGEVKLPRRRLAWTTAIAVKGW